METRTARGGQTIKIGRSLRVGCIYIRSDLVREQSEIVHDTPVRVPSDDTRLGRISSLRGKKKRVLHTLEDDYRNADELA